MKRFPKPVVVIGLVLLGAFIVRSVVDNQSGRSERLASINLMGYPPD